MSVNNLPYQYYEVYQIYRVSEDVLRLITKSRKSGAKRVFTPLHIFENLIIFVPINRDINPSSN